MSTTNNRVRSRQLSFRLTEKELSRWNKKQKASGLNKTEFLLKILDKSDVKIYQFNNTNKGNFSRTPDDRKQLESDSLSCELRIFSRSRGQNSSVPETILQRYGKPASVHRKANRGYVCCGGWRMAFGNVNVKFSPCKAVGQLKSAAAYILGKRPDQIRSGIKKTEPHLYNTFGCDRDNFSEQCSLSPES